MIARNEAARANSHLKSSVIFTPDVFLAENHGDSAILYVTLVFRREKSREEG